MQFVWAAVLHFSSHFPILAARRRAAFTPFLSIPGLCQKPQLDRSPSHLLQKRWLFVWRNLNEPGELDRTLERFPRAAAAGYNGVVFAPNFPVAKAADIRRAAETNHLALIAVVMNGTCK